MKFGFIMADGLHIGIININSNITTNNNVEYSNNKLKNSNYIFLNGEATKEISFTSIIPNYDRDILDEYIQAWKNNTELNKEVIIHYELFNDDIDDEIKNENYLESSSNYYWVGFELEDGLNNAVSINWSFIEYKPFQPVKKSFQVWNKLQTKKKAKKSKKVKTRTRSNANANTKILLGKCKNMYRNDKDKGIKCVKYLQKFLKQGGYYRGFRTDGWFSYYTQRELKKAQKRHGLPATGDWDTLTRVYYVVKYKYPAKTYNNLINGKSSKAGNKAYKILKTLKKKKKLR